MDTQRNKEFFYEIKKHLTPSRFYHSLNVAYEAYRLAGIYKADREKAFTAGLLHDIMKDTPKQEQLKIITDDGIILTPTEKSSTKTWHQLSGAVYIKKYLGVKDEDIISAVRYHTTGRENMTLLEKVVYIADYISADRKYPGVERMREKAYRSLDEAMLEGLQFTVIENVKKASPFMRTALKHIILSQFLTKGKSYDDRGITQIDSRNSRQKKGMDIKALKVTDLTVIADYFVIVTGTSPTHIKALSDDLEDKLAEKGKNAKSVEGKATGWILLDYGTVIVHVFTKESRENFNLEKLWGDAEEVDVSEWISE